jgi:hypothetical protein
MSTIQAGPLGLRVSNGRDIVVLDRKAMSASVLDRDRLPAPLGRP